MKETIRTTICCRKNFVAANILIKARTFRRVYSAVSALISVISALNFNFIAENAEADAEFADKEIQK